MSTIPPPVEKGLAKILTSAVGIANHRRAKELWEQAIQILKEKEVLGGS